jgi:hypothetical protein
VENIIKRDVCNTFAYMNRGCLEVEKTNQTNIILHTAPDIKLRGQHMLFSI